MKARRELPGLNGLFLTAAFWVVSSLATDASGPPHVLWRTNAHSYMVGSLSFSHDGELIASAAWTGDWGKIWRTSDATLQLLIDSYRINEDVQSVAFSPTDNLVAAAGCGESGDYEFSRLRVIRPTDGSLVWDRVVTRADCIFDSLLFSPDGRFLAYRVRSYYFCLAGTIDGAGGSCFDADEVTLHQSPPVAFSPDGRYFASIGAVVDCDDYDVPCGNHARLWNVQDFWLLKTLEGHSGLTTCLAFSPSGNALATGGGDNVVRVWNVPEGTTNREFEAHGAGVGFLTYAHDGKLFVSTDGTEMKFWRVSDGKLLTVYDRGIQGSSAFAVSPDGRFFALGGFDGSLTLAEMPLWISDIAQDNGQAVIHWYGGSGRYQVQSTSDLGNGVWADVGEPTTGTSSTNATASSTFFRVLSL